MRRPLLTLLFALLVPTATFTGGCENFLMDGDPANDAVTVFETLWTRTRDVYPYFELKRINWDSAYRAFRPRIVNGMSQRGLFSVLSEMLFLLRDGHVNLISSFDRSRNWEWYLDYPQNFDFALIERQYLDTALVYRINNSMRHGIFRRNGRRIGYIYCGSMSSSTPNSDIDNALVEFRSQNVSAVVFDVRDNGGGRADMAEIFAARFALGSHFAGTISYKSGPGPNDYTQPVNLTVNPQGISFGLPVIVLTNRSVYSAANYFVQLMTALPNVTVIGDVTGGGGGLPSYYDLPNGWTFRISSSRFRMPDGADTELGIAPDVRVDLDATDRSNGIDTILEEAFDRLDG